MKTERFTHENLLVLRKQMNDALTEVTKTTGVVFSIGNIRFDEVSFKVTLSARTTDEGGAMKASTDEKARADFAAASNGIKYGTGGVIGSSYVSARGELFTVVGYNSRKRKFPFRIDLPGTGIRNCTIGYLQSSTLLDKDGITLEQFEKWAMAPSDIPYEELPENVQQASDKVVGFLGTFGDTESVDELFDAVEKLYRKGTLQKHLTTFYNHLVKNKNLDKALLYVQYCVKSKK